MSFPPSGRDNVASSGPGGGRMVTLETFSTPIDQASSTPGPSIDPKRDTGLVEITIVACNNDTIAHLVTLELGGTAAGDRMISELPARSGFTLMVDRHRFARGLPFTGFADLGGVVNVYFQKEGYFSEEALRVAP